MRIPGWNSTLKSTEKKQETEVFVVDVEKNDKQPTNDDLEGKVWYLLLRSAVIVLGVFGITLYAIYDVQNARLISRDNRLEEQFWNFARIYDKSYDSPEEIEQAFDHFRGNMMDLASDRRAQPDVEFGFHQWMDQHFSTFREKFALGDQPLPNIEGMTPFEGFTEQVNRPASYSLRDKATPVKNQGSCGSCWAFATVASVETANALAGNRLVALSEQEMIECDTRNTGCRGGVRNYAMSFVVQNGLVPESTYPYTGKEGEQCHIGNSMRVYIKDFRLLSKSEDAMADWLFKTGPITFGMNVTRSLYSYRSGVFRPSEADCQEKSEGSHALTLMGYGSESGQDYWLVKNSWGDFWGDGGYFKLVRGGNVCGMANNVVAPMFS